MADIQKNSGTTPRTKYKDLGDGSYAEYIALEPASIAGGGAVDVSDRSARLLGHTTVDNASLAVTGTFWQTTQPVSGTFWQSTQPVSLATNTPDVTDRAARLLGHVNVDNASLAVTGTFWQATQPVSGTVTANIGTTNGLALDATLTGGTQKTKLVDTGGTNVASVKAASAIAVAADTALVVQNSPQRADASLWATTISGANATVTLTIAGSGAGLFHYITSIEIININPTATAIAGSAVTLAYTSTNIPTGAAWTAGNALAAGAEKVVTRITPITPIKSTTANTATTIVAPAIGAGGLCRINVTYYIAP